MSQLAAQEQFPGAECPDEEHVSLRQVQYPDLAPE